MTETSEDFLKKIGPRKLTAEEERRLHLLRLQEGKTGTSGFIEILSSRAAARKDKAKGDKDKA